MENRRTIKHRLILGGALLSAFLVLTMPVFAYDQDNTHPALTDEIADFYNLSFPGRKLSYQEKQWLIQGSINEDDGVRMLYHFYDPVHDRGLAMVAGASSKDWGLAANFQANILGRQYAGFASVFSDSSEADFSYGRALEDYAKGDTERAFIAFGHILHLLEDAGVPDHTRDDTHPPILDFGSPYEHEMAKWNPENFQISRTLFLKREKPVALSSMEGYLNRVANYSNNNFFSKDTISNMIYSKPNASKTEKIRVGNSEKLFIVNEGKDKFPLAFIDIKFEGGLLKGERPQLVSEKIGSHILDGYWERLSKEVIVNGAGALKLFLEEAEKTKKEYLAKQEQKKPSFWAQVGNLFGFGGSDDELTMEELTTPNQTEQSSDGTGQVSDGRGTSDVGNPQVTGDGDNGDTSGDKKVSPSLSPMSPSVSPSPLVIPKMSPLVSPTPKTSPSPSPILKPNSNIKTTGKVVINEIAWAGTMASANDEWIELYNTESYDIDLSGWVLKAEDGTPEITVEKNKIIKANGYFLFERTDDTAVNNIPADQVYAGALNNEGEVLRLTDMTGTVVDIVGKAGEMWSAGDSTGKISMERAGSSTSLGVNWKNFTGSPSTKDANGNFINGTPRAANSTTVVTFSSGGSGGGSTGSPQVSPTPTPTPTPTPSPSPTPTPSPSPDPDGDIANSGDVVINEIAWMGTASSANDEWIELYNTTNETINLTNWTLKSQDDTPDITLTGSISPLGFYVLERTDDGTLPSIVADRIYTGALGNEGESLTLKDTAGTIINQVDGSSDWKLNGDDWKIGDNDTKETAQKTGSGWITALPTPKAQNSANTTAQAPSAVTNLAASHGSPTVTVTWTAPDSGGYSIASLSYDLRYSSTSFSEAASTSWWSAATVVASSSLPSVGQEGASQSASFDIVPEYGLTLYFAIKIKVIDPSTCDSDDEDNCESLISNIATVSFPTAIDDNSWAMVGKSQYHTSLAGVAGPGAGATISWEFDAGSSNAVSQPVADADGNIYFGTADGSSGKLVKLNKNGVKQWEYSTSVSIGTPAVLSDEIVYFGRIGAGGVLAFTALNSDGSKKWDYNEASTVSAVSVSPKGEPHFAFQSGNQEKLLVLNTDGSLKTVVTGSGLSGFAAVVLDNGTMITAGKISGNQFFTAYSSGGTQLWQVFYTSANGSTPANPSYDQSTGKTYSAAGPKLFAIPQNPQDGPIPNSNVHDISQWGYSATTMVAISSDTLYVGFNSPTEASGSRVFALNKSDLTAKWSAPFHADGLLNKQLVVDKDANVYFSTQNGKLYSVNSAGSQHWIIDSGSNSGISPVLTQHGLIWSYGNKIIRVN